jgi:HEAT repeat protein
VPKLLGRLFLVFLIFPTLYISCQKDQPSRQETEIDAIITDLRSEDDETRTNAAYLLKDKGEEAKGAIPYLIKMLGDDNRFVAGAAVAGLAGVGAAAVPDLIKALADDNPHVRMGAAAALRAIAPDAPDAVPALIRALSDENEDVQEQAAATIGYIGPQAAAAKPVLIELIEHEDQDVAWVSLFALINIVPNDEDLITVCRKALGNNHLRARTTAAAFLVKKDKHVEEALAVLIEAVIEEESLWILQYPMILHTHGHTEIAVSFLINALDNEDAEIRRSAASMLGEIGPEAVEALPRLREIAADNSITITFFGGETLKQVAEEAIAKIEGTWEDDT